MKAEELRLNNLIYVAGSTLDTYQKYYVTKVTVALIEQILYENKERPDAILSKYNPIPLTEEWAIKFGYTIKRGTRADSSAVYFDIDDTYRVFLKTDLLPASIHLNAGDFFPVLKKLSYVHEFQNIIYELTGQEITMKE